MNKFTAAGLLCFTLTVTTAALAHHSFAMFDDTRRVTLEGTVREMQWTNPHIWLQLIVPANGKTVEYSIEGQSPNTLLRMGWTKNVIKAGDKVKVTIAPLKDGNPGGSLVSCVLSDGRTLSGIPL